MQVIDTATSFGAARFLRDISARNAWDTLRVYWIYIYQGPPEYIMHDAGKNFISTEFKQLVLSMSIEIKEVPVEAYNSVGKVERYHIPLRRASETLREKLKNENIDREMILQIAVKTVNNSAGPDRIIPMLLVFGVYPRITKIDLLVLPSVVKRAEPIRTTTKEVRRLYSERQVNNALAIRNSPSIITTLNLPFTIRYLSLARERWIRRPIQDCGVDRESCIIDMLYSPTKFRLTVVKPYYREDSLE